jgi:copper(I)-binding protein
MEAKWLRRRGVITLHKDAYPSFNERQDMSLRSFFVIAALSISASAFAHDHQTDRIVVGPSFARASLPGQNNGAAYLSLQNKSAATDTLVAVSSPAAKDVELHAMSMQDNVMRMRQVSSIELAPGASVTMQPGQGYHLMLMGLKTPLRAGDKLPLRLQFQHAGTIEMSIPVEDSMAGMPMKQH